MPRFCANLSFLFSDRPFLERFEAARRAGFEGVEFHFPYEFDKAEVAEAAGRAGVEVVLFNLPPGDWAGGERGLACLPDRVTEFREGVAKAIEYAKALGCRRVNCLVGLTPQGADPAGVRATLVGNLRFAARALAAEGIALVMEPLNTRSAPGFHLTTSAQAAALIEEVAETNLAIQYDVFHMQIMEGDLAKTIEKRLAQIGHMQIADVPDRHEPGTGEVNFDFLFDWIDRVGYGGWIGCEYVPAAGTEESLGWMRRYVAPLPGQQSMPSAPAAAGAQQQIQVQQ